MRDRPTIGSPKWVEDKKYLDSPSLNLDVKRQKVIVGSNPVHLTPAEFQTLWLLNRAGGGLITNDEITGFIYHDREKDPPGQNTIEKFIESLRKKLIGGDFKIVTVRERGYQLERNNSPEV